MIRNCSLEEISDGKLYSENDMVKADTNQCQGCNSVCCHGMGDSIVLDPYDICRLTRQLQMPFESLVEKHLALNVVDGVILPNLKMAGENETCGICTRFVASPNTFVQSSITAKSSKNL